jgi:hypothetical protein
MQTLLHGCEKLGFPLTADNQPAAKFMLELDPLVSTFWQPEIVAYVKELWFACLVCNSALKLVCAGKMRTRSSRRMMSGQSCSCWIPHPSASSLLLLARAAQCLAVQSVRQRRPYRRRGLLAFSRRHLARSVRQSCTPPQGSICCCAGYAQVASWSA